MTILCRSTLLAALAAGFLTAGVSSASAQADAIKWSAATKATTVKPGASFEVQVTADLGDGWHLYSITQAPPPIATRITVPAGQPFALAGSVEGPTPRVAFDQSFGIDTEFYEDSAIFVVPVKAAADAPGGKRKLRIDTYFQLCNDQLCLPPKTVSVEVELTIAGAPVAAAPAASTAAAAAAPVPGPAGSTPVAPPAPSAAVPSAALAPQTASPASGSLASASGSTAVPPASSAAAGQTGEDRSGGLALGVRLAGHDHGRALAADAVRLPDGAHHRLVLHQARGREPRQGGRAGGHLRRSASSSPSPRWGWRWRCWSAPPASTASPPVPG